MLLYTIVFSNALRRHWSGARMESDARSFAAWHALLARTQRAVTAFVVRMCSQRRSPIRKRVKRKVGCIARHRQCDHGGAVLVVLVASGFHGARVDEAHRVWRQFRNEENGKS